MPRLKIRNQYIDVNPFFAYDRGRVLDKSPVFSLVYFIHSLHFTVQHAYTANISTVKITVDTSVPVPTVLSLCFIQTKKLGSLTLYFYYTSFLLVGNLPENMYGASMTTTSKGDNVILTQNRNIYTLSIIGSEYKWIKLDEELSISRRYHLQFLVPASMIQC